MKPCVVFSAPNTSEVEFDRREVARGCTTPLHLARGAYLHMQRRDETRPATTRGNSARSFARHARTFPAGTAYFAPASQRQSLPHFFVLFCTTPLHLATGLQTQWDFPTPDHAPHVQRCPHGAVPAAIASHFCTRCAHRGQDKKVKGLFVTVATWIASSRHTISPYHHLHHHPPSSTIIHHHLPPPPPPPPPS